MKKIILLAAFFAVITGCSSGSGAGGELSGVTGRPSWFQPDPYGTMYIPMGSFNMGPNDEDVSFANSSKSKMVSIQSFYIDDSEITNNEYRQFVYWVRDSIARRLLASSDIQNAADFKIEQTTFLEMHPLYTGDNNLQDPYISWEHQIEWNSIDETYRLALQPLYIAEPERFFNRKVIDSRKLNFEYLRYDIKASASKKNRFIPSKSPDVQEGLNAYKKKEYINGVHNNDGVNGAPGTISTVVGDPQKDGKSLGGYDISTLKSVGQGNYVPEPIKNVDRSVFIIKDIINVYPDTLAWVSDFTYAYNEPLTNNYFWHPAYDDYPVVGVTWKQARAFSIWRTNLLHNYLMANGEVKTNDFRLPTEAEWEYAARGGLENSPYPWGGPYIRNVQGCFLGNFKPMRGSYINDGGLHTVYVHSYSPNEYGIYCMSGNVAEWTSAAFDESAYDFSHDLNPHYEYEAQDKEDNVMKRKVVRGGSWKDIGYFLQVGSRSYEYQDTAKCYIGFRNVMTYMGRNKDDKF